MIFAGKQKPDSPVSKENPRSPRYVSIARVCIIGFEGEATLRNISIGGFHMESKTYAAITAGEHYNMQIKPEAASNLPPFDWKGGERHLEVEVRWIQSTETGFNSGFLIVRHPPNRSLEQYIDYTKTRD